MFSRPVFSDSCFSRQPYFVLALFGFGIFACFQISTTFGRVSIVDKSTPQNDSSNYAIVIDAGSSGSRAYLYYWPEHSGDPKTLLKIEPLLGNDGEPLVKSVSPGLSSLADTPTKAGEYISALLDFASDSIPDDKQSSTQLFILATAGMRLLPEAKQTAIISNLRSAILQNYSFTFPDKNLEVITGKEEGLYQWISINFVLGKLDRSQGDGIGDEPRTVGALDMGGASLQIAVEIPPGHLLESLSGTDRSHIDTLNLGALSQGKDHIYKVFVTTFLGYGANEALGRHRRDLFLSQLEKIVDPRKLIGLSSTKRLADPCLSSGLEEEVELTIDPENLSNPSSKKFRKVLQPGLKVYLKGSGDWNECYIQLSKFIRSRETYLKSCQSGEKGCPDAGIQKPPIDFATSEFYGFSEFWYTSQDVLGMGGPYTFDKFKQASQHFCGQDWSVTNQKYEEGQFPLADVDRMKTQCFKSAWVAVALHQGLSFPETYSRLTAAPNSVNGRVIHWTLGALLYRTRFLPKDPKPTSVKKRFEDKVQSFLLTICAIEAKLRMFHNSRSLLQFIDYSHFLILLFLATIMAFVFLYLKRLRRFVTPSSTLIPSLRQSPSSAKLAPILEGGWTLLKTSEDELGSPRENGSPKILILRT